MVGPSSTADIAVLGRGYGREAGCEDFFPMFFFPWKAVGGGERLFYIFIFGLFKILKGVFGRVYLYQGRFEMCNQNYQSFG